MKQQVSEIEDTQEKPEHGSNHLFPIFLKLEQMRLLIVGGGNVGLEKLTAVLQNAPATRIRLVAIAISGKIRELAEQHPNIELVEKAFEPADLDEADIVITALNDHKASEQICNEAKKRNKLINAADKPDLCDFYLSSVVKKGNLKIAISTNGKSPTIAKRLRETLEDVIPAEMDDLLRHMQTIRNRLDGDFAEKVERLNRITEVLAVQKPELTTTAGEKWWKKVATWSLFAFLFMILGHIILSYVPLSELWTTIKAVPGQIETKFFWMILTGFLAQLVDGALGMGYGVTCTTILLTLGISPSAISASIHTAEMFSSGASGYSHYKFGNVNKKLFKVLLVPGIIGAVAGAFLLSKFGDDYAGYIRPVLACYTLLLGLRIIYTAFKKRTRAKKVKHVGWLAGAGGFLDSFGGGGWGPLVTSTLISKGRTPRYVIGSVSITEFFVTFASALTFFSLIGISHWQIILGLILGGLLGAPLAARLSGKLPMKAMFIGVGVMVIIWSLRIIIKAIL